LLGCDQTLEAVKHSAVQLITGKNGGRHDAAKSSPQVSSHYMKTSRRRVIQLLRRAAARPARKRAANASPVYAAGNPNTTAATFTSGRDERLHRMAGDLACGSA
jgi:hypothetical protein